MNRPRTSLLGPLAPAFAVLAGLLLSVGLLAPGTGTAASKAPPITVFFDHLATGFELDGVHRDLPC